MRRVIIRATLITFASVVMATLMICSILPILGQEVPPTALFMGVLCPLVIAFPISTFILRQSDRFAAMHQELLFAHRQLAEAHSELASASRTDPMTGVLNRDAFFSAVSNALGNDEEGTLLIGDADHFKRINDTFGHPAGDEALVLIARAIQSSIDECDILGRIGGEEFGLFLSGAIGQQAQQKSEKIRQSVESISFEPNNQGLIALTISLGGAAIARHASINDVMKTADVRLYDAKNAGRNCVVLNESRLKAA